MGWAFEKASFWRRRDLSSVLKQVYRLEKEASMSKEEFEGYESPDNCLRNGVEKGSSGLSGPDSAWMCSSSRGRCFLGIPHQRSSCKARTLAGPLLFLWGLRSSPSSPEGSGSQQCSPPRRDLQVNLHGDPKG